MLSADRGHGPSRRRPHEGVRSHGGDRPQKIISDDTSNGLTLRIGDAHRPRKERAPCAASS